MTLMSTISIFYCGPCLKPFEEYGEIALSAYITICEYYVGVGQAIPIWTKTAGRGTLEIVMFLELKGYVLTTEIDKSVYQVKPTNHHYACSRGHFFCRNQAEHWPKFLEEKRK